MATETCRSWISKNYTKYKTKNSLVIACTKKLKIDKSTVYRSIQSLKIRFDTAGKLLDNQNPCKEVANDVKGGLKSAISAEDIKVEFDVPKKIRSGIRQLGNKIIRDSDFRMELKINPIKWKAAVELEEFENNQLQISIPGKWKGIIWGKKKVLDDIKTKIDVV